MFKDAAICFYTTRTKLISKFIYLSICTKKIYKISIFAIYLYICKNICKFLQVIIILIKILIECIYIIHKKGIFISIGNLSLYRRNATSIVNSHKERFS